MSTWGADPAEVAPTVNVSLPPVTGDVQLSDVHGNAGLLMAGVFGLALFTAAAMAVAQVRR